LCVLVSNNTLRRRSSSYNLQDLSETNRPTLHGNDEVSRSNRSGLGLSLGSRISNMTCPTLVDSIQNSIISDGVLCSLSLTALCRLSLTCKVANEAVEDYRRRAWNINTYLRRFFHDPLAFRSLQARTDTIIYGFSALEFFSWLSHPNTNLDICVPLQHVLKVGQWLMSADGGGYSFRRSQDQDPDFEKNAELIIDGNMALVESPDDAFSGVAAIYSFVRSKDGGCSAGIQMTVAESSFFKILFNSSSSEYLFLLISRGIECRFRMSLACLMNFITFRKAYSLYPLYTFERYRGLIMAHEEGIHKIVIQKCRDRGWTLEADPLACSADLLKCRPRRRSRWAGDKFCWTVALPIDGALFQETSQTLPIELNGWFLTPTRRETGRSRPSKDWRTRCIVMRCPGLKFTYVLPKTMFWIDFLLQWTHSTLNSLQSVSLLLVVICMTNAAIVVAVAEMHRSRLT
jgi:hypothetical protein